MVAYSIGKTVHTFGAGVMMGGVRGGDFSSVGVHKAKSDRNLGTK